jgi:preprotein translocase YajC subunit
MVNFLGSTTPDTSMIWVIAAIAIGGLAFMMLLSRRRNKVAREEAEKMLDELRPGRRVRTYSGIIGRIKEIREESPAHTTDKGVQIPAVKTVLIETGYDKNTSFMLFDIHAIHGIIPEEGHTIEGLPIAKLPAPEKQELLKDPSDIDAREYVDKRNAKVASDKNSLEAREKKQASKKKK